MVAAAVVLVDRKLKEQACFELRGVPSGVGQRLE
jgi:hypothetical protein